MKLIDQTGKTRISCETNEEMKIESWKYTPIMNEIGGIDWAG